MAQLGQGHQKPVVAKPVQVQLLCVWGDEVKVLVTVKPVLSGPVLNSHPLLSSQL